MLSLPLGRRTLSRFHIPALCKHVVSEQGVGVDNNGLQSERKETPSWSSGWGGGMGLLSDRGGLKKAEDWVPTADDPGPPCSHPSAQLHITLSHLHSVILFTRRTRRKGRRWTERNKHLFTFTLVRRKARLPLSLRCWSHVREVCVETEQTLCDKWSRRRNGRTLLIPGEFRGRTETLVMHSDVLQKQRADYVTAV